MSIGRLTLQQYWRQVRKFRVSFFIMLIVIPLSNVLITSALPYTFSQTIGKMTTQDIDSAWHFFVLSLAIGATGIITNFIGFYAMVVHEANIISTLRKETFRSLLQKDMHFYSNEKIGALTSKYIDYIRSETSIQDTIIIRTIGFLVSLIIGVGVVMTKSVLLGVIIIALVVVLLLQVKLSLWIRRNWRRERKELRSEIHGYVADSLTNQLVVKTFTGEDNEYSHIANLTNRFKKAYLKDIGFVMTEGSIRVFLSTAVQIITLGISISLLTQGRIDIATIIFSMSFLQLIGANLFTLGELMNGLQEALLEAQPMTEMLAKENRVTDGKRAKVMPAVHPTIELDNVSYAYEEDVNLVLRDISLTIPAGQKVGLVGHSGAGKTTLSHLLLRFADVTSGEIRIGGHNIRAVTQKSLRRQIAFVPQEPLLFHRSLRENIAYGNTDATDEMIERAAREANAWEFIKKLPHGLNTFVGERGVKLSGGQRQRIAIARAILKDAPILLLDEATSALDSESEKLIQDALTELMQGRTSVVIAHRLSTIAKLDRIIVLDNGRVAEDGTHTELLARNGIYAKFWQRQSGGFIEE